MSRFRCYRSGECCKLEKYTTKEEFIIAKDALLKLNINLHGITMPSGMILWDKPCPALKQTSKDEYTCLIYNKRPYPCRQFLCGRQFKGDTRPFNDGNYNLNYFKELLKNPEFAKIKKRIEDKAAIYGNKHGWKLKRK